ncbi:MAG: hypothetical protein K2X45_21550 [Phreatobacter sp.]|nr:hypothetical protein [Phreatobacter sp.]
MNDGFNEPERRRRAVTALLWLTPVLFGFGYGFVYLTEFRPTPQTALIAGLASAGLALAFAALLAAFGPAWMSALRVVAIGVALITLLLNACTGS